MAKDYSIMRRIWRIVYPILIFLSAQFIAAAGMGVYYSVKLLRNGASDVMMTDFIYLIMAETERFLIEHSMLYLLICNLFCMLIFVPMWLRISNNHDEPTRNDRPIVVYMLIAGFFAAFNIVQMVVFALTDVIRHFPAYEEAALTYMTDSLLIQVIGIGIAAPIVEELVFRGIVMSSMRWMPEKVAVIVQALLFGLIHMNLFQGLYAFIAGVLLGLVYIKFKSLTAVIIGHASYNLSSVLLAEFVNEDYFGFVVVAGIVMLPLLAGRIIRHPKARRVLLERDMFQLPALPESWTNQ